MSSMASSGLVVALPEDVAAVQVLDQATDNEATEEGKSDLDLVMAAPECLRHWWGLDAA